MVLQIDTREPVRSNELKSAARQCGIPYEVITLKVGDYRCYPFIWERKSIGDFYEKFNKGDIFDQLNRLVKHCAEVEEIPGLFIHGDIEAYIKMRRKVTRNRIADSEIIEAAAEIMLTYPQLAVQFYFTSNLTYILQNIVFMAQYAKNLAGKYRFRRGSNYDDSHDLTINILREQLKIPINVAEELRVKIGTLHQIIHANDADLDAIKGVSIKTIEKINSLRKS